MGLGELKERPDFDLNLPAENCLSELGFQSSVQFGNSYPDNQAEIGSGGGMRRIEQCAEGETSGSGPSGSKRMRFTVEEKGKAKIDDSEPCEFELELDLDLDLNLNLGWGGWEECLVNESVEGREMTDLGSSMGVHVLEGLDSFPVTVERNSPREILDHAADLLIEENFIRQLEPEERLLPGFNLARYLQQKQELDALRQREVAREVAQRFHLEAQEQHQQEQEKKRQKIRQLKGLDKDLDVSQSPFVLAMESIKKRQDALKKSLSGSPQSLFKWVPANRQGCNDLKRDVPTLLDISLNGLAKNSDAIVSLDFVPNELRRRISHLVSDARKVDAHFVKLLASGSPTEICVRDISQLTEEEFTKNFGGCDSKDLTVLQLDLCGRCMPDYVLRDTLARSPNRLASLATLSLRGAHRLSDISLTDLTKSAPALRSINLSQCSLLTSHGISDLATDYEASLREFYIDDCQNIDAMIILPALKKVKHLEVLSVAGIQTVSDDFVIELAQVSGKNMKELVFARCVELTDISIRTLSKTCPKLCALDLSYLQNLTDASLQYLANGCRSIQRLILCRNDFSDEAVAAFLEASGESLNVLSLNNVREVALNTALSIATCLRNLWSLDLSWCRRLTDEALGLIVDSCLSLKLVKLFGCTQITDVFLNGHSNSSVQMVGCKTKPLLEHLDVLEPQKTPLRYSPLTDFADHQSVDSPDT